MAFVISDDLNVFVAKVAVGVLDGDSEGKTVVEGVEAIGDGELEPGEKGMSYVKCVTAVLGGIVCVDGNDTDKDAGDEGDHNTWNIHCRARV